MADDYKIRLHWEADVAVTIISYTREEAVEAWKDHQNPKIPGAPQKPVPTEEELKEFLVELTEKRANDGWWEPEDGHLGYISWMASCKIED